MRLLLVLTGSALMALALAAGTATASAARPFHGGGCQTVSPTWTICFEAWGVVKQEADGGYIGISHRRFTEFRSGVMTYEQRDHGHRIIHLDASGAEHVNIYYFSGWSTPTGLVCKWRENLVIIDGEAVHSVDQLSCESA